MRIFLQTSAAALVLLGAGCSGSKPAPDAAAQALDVTVFYTCDTRGNIHACDCTDGTAGGIARRMTYLDGHPAANRLLVDAGNVGAGVGARDVLDLDFILRGYRAMGYDAINAGRGEATLGAERLRALAQAYPELVSANLVDDAGKVILPPFVVKRLPNGLRVGILGVMEGRASTGDLGPGLQALPVEDALARHLPEAQRQADVVLVLAYADERRMQELAGLFYEIDIMIGGLVEQPTADPVLINRTLLTAITDKGKSIGRLDLVVDGSRIAAFTNEITMLYENFADAPGAAGILAEHAQAVAALTNAVPLARELEKGMMAIPVQP